MNEELKYAIEHGIIDISYMQKQIEMNKRKEFLEKHPYTIWQGKDGYWHTYLPDKEKGRIPRKKSTQESIQNDVIEYWKSELENPTIREVFEEWNNRRLELQKISSATHLRNAQVFNRHYGELGLQKIKSVDPEDIGEFLEEQVSKFQLTSKGFSNLKTITRGFLKRAKKRKLITFSVEDIFNDLDTSETDFKKIIKEDYEEVFNEDETPIMIDYLTKNADLMNLGILLMFVTGARIGEVVTLKHSDFDGNSFKIRRTETRYLDENKKNIYTVKDFPKSQAGVRIAIIPEGFVWISQKLKMQNPFSEFIFEKNGKRITTAALRSRLRSVCDKTGIYRKSPHKIRKTYGTILLDNHIDNKLIMGQMGHTDIACTEGHYHRNRRTIQRKSEILSNIPDFKVK